LPHALLCVRGERPRNHPENVSKPPEAARTVELAKELGLDAKAVEFRSRMHHAPKMSRVWG
jgi:hypothetical protein